MIRISVALATCNGARFLRQQLDSLAAQQHSPVELQIGDDGSTDETLAIIAEFARTAPFPVIVHSNPGKLGYGENFLATAKRCSGEWIAFCDQDDVWLPEKLTLCAEAIRTGPPALMFVAHDAVLADSGGESVGSRLYGYRSASLRNRLAREPTWFCAGFTQVFRTELVHIVPTSPRAELPHLLKPEQFSYDRFAHDVWIPILANILGDTLVLPEALVLYRRHLTTTTNLPPPPTRKTRLNETLRSNGARYAYLARWARDTANAVEALASRTSSEDASSNLSDGAVALREYALAFERRSEIYGDARRSQKLTGVIRLWTNGNYTRARWSFRPISALKDLVYALR